MINMIYLGFNNQQLIFTMVWLALLVCAVIIESQTTELVSIWFAVGALCASIASIFNADIIIQIILFLGVSVIFIIVSRPFVKKMMRVAPVKMNKEKYIDKICVVTECIESLGKGKVLLEGQIWNAKATSNQNINVDEKVIITAIEGNTLIVDKITNIEIN